MPPLTLQSAGPLLHPLLLALLCACGSERNSASEGGSPSAPVRVNVTVRPGEISVADSVRSGWARLRVEEPEGRHIVVLYRLTGTRAEPLDALLAALDTAAATPPSLRALGGPEIGAAGEIVLDLAPGAYLLACLQRSPDGHRHAIAGEARLLRVGAGRVPSEAPRATASISMADFAFGVDAPFPAGPHLLRVENTGRQDHQLRIEQLHPGVDLQTWLNADAPAAVGTPLAGVARMSPGAVAYLPLTLTPGRYVLYCLVPDPGSRRPHAEMGMLREIRVD